MSTKPQHPLAQLGQLTHVSTGSSLQHHHQQSKEHDPVQSAQLLNQHIHHETAGHSEMFYGHHPDPAFHLMQQPTNLPIIAAATAQKEQHQWISEFQQEQLQPQPPQERVWSAGSSSSSTQSYPIGYPISRLHSVNNDILLRSGHQVSMLPQQWDQDFLQELDRKWTDEFSHNETVRENLMKSAPTADWDQMFSTVEASKIEANESRQQESLDKALEETWKSLDSVDLNDIAVNKEPSDDLTVNAAPISDELDFADWDDEYGSALASSIQSPSQQQKQMDFKEYQFESDNRHKDQPDPFAEGMRLLEAGGSLTEAALAFEAAVQLDPRHANAWAMLGKVQAENEKEEPAISALQHAIRENPQHLDALMVCFIC
jgi:peroxin-5